MSSFNRLLGTCAQMDVATHCVRTGYRIVPLTAEHIVASWGSYCSPLAGPLPWGRSVAEQEAFLLSRHLRILERARQYYSEEDVKRMDKESAFRTGKTVDDYFTLMLFLSPGSSF